MIVKKFQDHVVTTTPTCGVVHGILTAKDYRSANVAVCLDIRPTNAHFHRGFDEIYFVLDGSIRLDLYDPSADAYRSEHLSANELCVISRGVHHVITEATERNRLCVITVPFFDPADEHPSDRLNAAHPTAGPAATPEN